MKDIGVYKVKYKIKYICIYFRIYFISGYWDVTHDLYMKEVDRRESLFYKDNNVP